MTATPPLSTLRAFESVARHRSISRAAEELHLTHGAVSHQIKKLEALLDMQLVARQGRGIVLTSSGEMFSQKLRSALSQLEQVLADVVQQRTKIPLKISALPSLAACWLMARLVRFQALHPNVELHLHTSSELVELGRGGFDLAVRYGSGAWKGTIAEKLMDEDIVVVCSPACDYQRLLATPLQMLEAPLLRDTHVSWARWFSTLGIHINEPANTLVYTDSGLLVQAAVAGQGVALVRAILARDDLAAGRLIKSPIAAVPAGLAYYAVYTADTSLSLDARAFLAWIKNQAHIPQESAD